MGASIKKDFEFIDHTADVGVIAYGQDIRQAFANAARALSSLIAEPEDVRETQHRDIVVTAADEEGLLVEWLNELIYLFDAEGLIFKRFDINSMNGRQLRARAYGEKVDPARHRLKAGVKAATYHLLKVDRDNGGRVQVIFDV
jgi:SHS2 domain-containing protein